jgi:hypothetical protein
MAIVDPGQSYRLIRADGTVVLNGSFSELMERIPQSTARLDVEGAIRAARDATIQRLALAAREDSLRVREAAVAERIAFLGSCNRDCVKLL